MTTETIDLAGLADLLLKKSKQNQGRLLAALAGPPGSGKSTLADRLIDLLNADVSDHARAALLPMDGFHYDDILLNALGRRERKGALDTFDVGGLRQMLRRLRDSDDDEDAIAVPVFDRDIEIARAGARLISREVGIIVVEGNYLLLRQPPWAALRALFDVTVMIETDTDTLRERLTQRWQHYQLSPEEIRAKVEGNDLPNGAFVVAESGAADYRLLN
jgi:pantothenate kinase